MSYYIDTSAFVKLVALEPESVALRAWIESEQAHLVSSDLLRTEALRAVQRAAPELLERTHDLLTAITLMTLPTAAFIRAGQLDPRVLRSLDALHLAAALDLSDDLEAIVTYDARMSEAASLYGIHVVAPSA